ncbi:MAG: tetratricopeptide repeat protein [Planctomycetia bacterium]|nr:tetratricopeptide repeat protein [Planctomycetia bacterium]
MNESEDPNKTIDFSSNSAEPLEAKPASGFETPSAAPRSSLGGIRAVLLREAEADSAPGVDPNSDAMPQRSATGDRYQISGEIARGGMGAVLRGRDVDLGRDLAVKVLLEKYADRPDVARRFIEEAQIGGQLQHPGVVPVYDVGRFGDRPFFTMKLVKGKTLAALLGERADATADLPRYLSIALQVAQTLAYAHSKGVIHRDLKPANIMVGAFGEVQVMDWGLAKVLADVGTDDQAQALRKQEVPEDVSTIRTARSTDSSGGFGTETEAGSLLGTPAYMPPEQANGDIANLDRRADVFGLGAILCEILSGKPPYLGRSGEEVRRKAANGDLADAFGRLDHCGADAELIVLTRKCLTPEAADRLQNANAVADALTAYLDGVQARLRRAELAEAESRARAIEEAKRRRLTLALASTVIVALTLGGGGWLWVKADRDARQVQLTRDVNEAVNKATALREQAKSTTTGSATLFAQAREQAQRALALVENGLDDTAMKGQVRQLQSELDEEVKDRNLLAALEEARLSQTEIVPEENRFASERAIPMFRTAFAAYGLPAGAGEPATAAALIRKRPGAVRETMLAALEEWGSLAREPKLKGVEPHAEWLQAVFVAAEEDGWTKVMRETGKIEDKAQRQTALEKLATTADVDKLPARSLDRLSWRLENIGSLQIAAQLLRRTQQRYPADFWVNHRLGQLLKTMAPPEPDEAVRFLTAAVAIRPDSPGALLNLASALDGNEQADEAIANYKRAIEIEPKYATARINLGNLLKKHGQVEEAIACYEQGIKFEPKEARFHQGLGAIFCDNKKEYDKAILCFRKAIELDPKYANAFVSQGVAQRGKGQIDEAIACHKKAIEIQPENAAAHRHLGAILCDLKHEYAPAILCFRKAIQLNPKDADAYSNLGVALLNTKQVDESLASYARAIELEPTKASAHGGLGSALLSKGKVDEAIVSFRKAIELDPALIMAHGNLGNALRTKGLTDEAIASYQEIIKLDPKETKAHIQIGNALWASGRIDEAIVYFRTVVDLAPTKAAGHINLGAILCDNKHDYEGAIQCFRKAIQLEPASATAHLNLGNALRAMGQATEAITSYKRAIAIDSMEVKAYTGLGAALMEEGQLADAISYLGQAVQLEPKFVPAHGNLGLALMREGHLDDAIACFRTSIRLDPRNAATYNNLGTVFMDAGRLEEAIVSYKQAIELDPTGAGPRRDNLALAERLVAVRDKFPDFEKGTYSPTTTVERLAMAKWCKLKKRHRAAVDLYTTVFDADSKLADDTKSGLRYIAACDAAMAAAGLVENSAKLDDKERVHLGQQAISWLQADLAGYSKLLANGSLAGGTLVRQKLRHWQRDSDLAGIRDKAAMDKFTAEERKAFAQLWVDVAALLKKAETPTAEDRKK